MVQQVLDGERVLRVVDPVKEGYTFEGWFTDPKFTYKFDFNQPITQDMVIYAKWDGGQTTFTVIYTDGETSVTTTVPAGLLTLASNGVSSSTTMGLKANNAETTNFTKQDYSFGKWQIKVKGKTYWEGEQVYIDSDTVVDVVWVNGVSKDDQEQSLPPGECAVKKSESVGAEVIIPRIYTSWDGPASTNYEVTKIADSAFSSNAKVTNVDIPESVTVIGNSAFSGCTKLATVKLSSTNPPTLGTDAFENCSNDLKIYVPKEAVTSYQSQSSWSNVSDKIKAEPEVTYLVTYDGNGATSGEVPVDGINHAKNSDVLVLGNTGNLEKTNYYFAGWSTQPGGGTTYQAGDKFNITGNTTLYAKWSGGQPEPETDNYTLISGTVKVNVTPVPEFKIHKWFLLLVGMDPNTDVTAGTEGVSELQNVITNAKEIKFVTSTTPGVPTTGLKDLTINHATGTGKVFGCYDSSNKKIYIISEGSKVVANQDSSYLFAFMPQQYISSSLKTISGLEMLDTSNVTDMSYLFAGCADLTELDLSNFKTSNLTKMDSMFAGCSDLTAIYAASGADWSTLPVTSSNMFSGCSALKGGNGTTISGNPTDKTYARIDGGTSNKGYFTKVDPYTLRAQDTWFNNFGVNKSDITDIVFTTSTPSTFTSGPINVSLGSNTDPTKGVVGYVVDNTKIYIVAPAGKKIYGNPDSSFMFFDPSQPQSSPFTSLTSITFGPFDTSKVTNMSRMFKKCSNLTSLDLSKFDTSNVTDMDGMFYGCSKLNSLDLSSWNRSTDPNNTSTTSNVTTMSGMFGGCSKLGSLNLDKFNTSNVKNMSGMFQECSSLTTLDLSGFDTSKVTNMSAMFNTCSKLATIYAASGADWSTLSADSQSMFGNCSKLEGGNGSNLQTPKASSETSASYSTDKTRARIDDAPTNPGYFTEKGKTLSSITVKTNPTKTSYTLNQTTNYSGLVIEATYSNSTKRDITYDDATKSKFTFNPNEGATLSTAGVQTVSVSYTEGGVTKSTSFDITVNSEPEYLTFSIVSNSSPATDTLTVTPSQYWTGSGSGEQAPVTQYSKYDGNSWSGWSDWTSGAVGGTGITKIRFRGKNCTQGSATSDGTSCEKWTVDSTAGVSVSGNIMTLLDYTDPDNATMGDFCFYFMFEDCTKLTSVSEDLLPAGKGGTGFLATWCYGDMFDGCSSLTAAPALPATTLATSCYYSMFKGCTSLSTLTIPTGKDSALPATTLADNCYSQMFYGCSSLKVAQGGSYPATQKIFTCPSGLSSNEVKEMFTGTGGLFAGTPTGTGSGTPYYYGTTDSTDYLTFTGTNVTVNPYGSSSTGWIGSGSEIRQYSIKVSGSNQYEGWYDWDETEQGHPAIGAGKNAVSIRLRGKNCTTGSNCIAWTIGGDTTVSASGNIMTLLDYTNPEEKTLYDGATQGKPNNTACFANMFQDCTKLTSAPALPATTLVKDCYYFMFYGCTALQTAPELPAGKNGTGSLAECCYCYMFYGCTSLTSAPALPAQTMVKECYSGMFYGCTGLTLAPALPATTLADDCYKQMFRDCSSLIVTEGDTGADKKIFTCTNNSNCTDMFTGTATFGSNSGDGTPSTNTTYYYDEYLTFSSDNGTVSVTPSSGWTATTKQQSTSKDGATWSAWTNWSSGAVSGKKVRFRGTGGTNTTGSNGQPWKVTGPGVKVSGDIMTILDYKKDYSKKGNKVISVSGCFNKMFAPVDQQSGPPISNPLTDASGLILPATTLIMECYLGMFGWCLELTKAPALPATTLAQGCYYEMFYACWKLTTAPELPAGKKVGEETVGALAKNCYSKMFSGCTGLKTAPALPATSLAEGCYSQMFYGCSALETAPALPATTLTANCYSGMFSGCTGLKTAPALPATKLADNCYNGMFGADINGYPGCTLIQTPPALPATTLAYGCYCSMFKGCTGLTTAPELPAGKEEGALAKECYCAMFSGCTGLTTAPNLPATTLADSCYYSMFYGCTGLTTAPNLPATNYLPYSCYRNMFNGCTKLNSVTVNFTNWNTQEQSTTDWLEGVASSGTRTFTCPSTLQTAGPMSGGSASTIPDGWTVVNP